MELIFTIIKWLVIGILLTTFPSSLQSSKITFKVSPVVVYVLIIANVLIYLAMFIANWHYSGFYNYEFYNGICQKFGFRPSLFVNPQNIEGSYDVLTILISTISLITYQFLHGGFFHLLGNMMALHLFGPSVESGQNIKFNAYTKKPINTYFPFPVFYILCGVGAALFHLLIAFLTGGNAMNTVLVGASGSISGVMGAYLLGRWKDYNKVTIHFLIIFHKTTSINWYILYWIILQVVLVLMYGANSAVSFSAHIGGFLTGIILWKFVTPWINNAAQPKARGWFGTKG